MLKFKNEHLKLKEGSVFQGTCGAYFKIMHKCDKDTYCVKTLGLSYKLKLRIKKLYRSVITKIK